MILEASEVITRIPCRYLIAYIGTRTNILLHQVYLLQKSLYDELNNYESAFLCMMCFQEN